jgi:hypothetical protein
MEEVRMSNPPKAVLKVAGSFFNAQNLEFGPDKDDGGISCLSWYGSKDVSVEDIVWEENHLNWF